MSDVTINTPDPFNPAALRLDASAGSSIGVKKLLTTVPVRKPNRQTFVRVHPDEAYRLTTAVIEHKEDNEIYLLAPQLHRELIEEAQLVTLCLTIDRQGNVSLWPVKVPREDGRANNWHLSARDAAEQATKKWVRVVANMSLGAYDIHAAVGNLSEPAWPDLEMAAILRIAFQTRYITDTNHHVLKKLRGDV